MLPKSGFLRGDRVVRRWPSGGAGRRGGAAALCGIEGDEGGAHGRREEGDGGRAPGLSDACCVVAALAGNEGREGVRGIERARVRGGVGSWAGLDGLAWSGFG